MPTGIPLAERVKYMKKIISCLIAFAISISFINTAFCGYNVVTDADHNMLDILYSSVGKASKNSKWAIVDENGNPITDYRWDALGTVSGDLIPAMSGGIWGYIAPNGTTVIPFQFAKAYDFFHIGTNGKNPFFRKAQAVNHSFACAFFFCRRRVLFVCL